MSIAQNDTGVEPGPVILRREGAIALVTLCRPASRNAVNPELAQELERIVAEVERDDEVKVAILTGEGDQAFCAGADLREVAAGRLDDCFTGAGGFGGFVNASRAKPSWSAGIAPSRSAPCSSTAHQLARRVPQSIPRYCMSSSSRRSGCRNSAECPARGGPNRARAAFMTVVGLDGEHRDQPDQ